MQFGKFGKIISAGALATVMTASTMAFAATLADYPAPFVSDGTVPSLVVVGARAAPSDVVGAIDMAARLGAEPSQTKSVTCPATPGSAATSTVSGGVLITSDGNKTYLNQPFGSVKATLTSKDLPTILATQQFTDKNSTTITYNQYIELGSSQVVSFGTPSSENEPSLYSTFGSGKTYNAKVIFLGGLDTSAVDSNYKLTLFGKEYTFGGTNQTNTSIELYSSTGAETILLDKVGATKTVTVDGTTYTFELKGYSSSGNTAYFYVNGQPTSTYGWVQGNTYTVGGVKVFVSSVSVVKTGAQEESATVKLFVGTDKLVLTHGTQVQKNDNALVNTAVSISASGSKINSITITVAPDLDTYLKEGSAFVDPVFGSFKFVLGGMSIPATDSNRDYIELARSGTDKARLTFTNKDGTKYQQTVFYWSTGSGWQNKVDSTHDLAVAEANLSAGGANNLTVGDYFVLTDANKKASYIYRYASYNPSTTASSRYVTLTDAATGVSQKVYVNTSDPYLRIGESAFKVMWTDAGYGSDYSIGVDLNADGSIDFGDVVDQIYTIGEATLNLTTAGTVKVKENPLFTVGNDPTGTTMTITATNSSSEATGFTFSPTTYGGQVGSANKYKYMTLYGTYVETDTDADTVKIYYPGTRPSYALVAVGSNPVFSTTQGTTGTPGSTTTYESVVPITTPIAKLDTEITSADRTAKNLILVGGPCVNTLVAELASAGKLTMGGEALTCDAWNAKSAAGDLFGLIEIINDAFSSGKAALVVAGSTAAETREATSVLQNYAAHALTGSAVKIVGNVVTPVTVA